MRPSSTTTAGLVLAAALACGACSNGTAAKGRTPAPETGSKENAMMEWKGPFCAVLQGTQRVIESEPEWRKAWAQIGQPAPDAPDFKSQFAVVVFLGQRNTGGYGVRWLDPELSGTATVVRYKEARPTGMTMQVLTQPYAVKVFPRTSAEIKVEAARD